MRPAYTHPALNLLTFRQWDDAFEWLHSETGAEVSGVREQALLDALNDRAAIQIKIRELVARLYAVATPRSGALALAWQMLTVDPRQPNSFRHVLPQLQFEIDNANLEDDELRERIRIWWRAAEGACRGAQVSIFAIAATETMPDADPPFDPPPPVHDAAPRISSPPAAPTLVVMPKSRATKLNNFHATYKDILDAALPLVVARDVQGIRLALQREFPHATVAVDLMLRDLREGRPVALKPICLVSAPGAGKSRLVRRVANLIHNLYVYRFDASSSSDSHFGGTSKAWSNTEPSVPARAVAQSLTANPMVLIDEIDKAAERNWNGRLWDSLLPFCDPETAGRYRDQSLDAELDLSMCSIVATANDASKLPGPLRDRMRIIRVPSPTLAHLPQLAALVMRDLAIEDEARAHDEPLAPDELAIIAKAWTRASFSMRKLQKIVFATLEARDSHAMRH